MVYPRRHLSLILNGNPVSIFTSALPLPLLTDNNMSCWDRMSEISSWATWYFGSCSIVIQDVITELCIIFIFCNTHSSFYNGYSSIVKAIWIFWCSRKDGSIYSSWLLVNINIQFFEGMGRNGSMWSDVKKITCTFHLKFTYMTYINQLSRYGKHICSGTKLIVHEENVVKTLQRYIILMNWKLQASNLGS